MFESSLLESGGVLKTRSSRWAIATFFFNTAVLFLMILIPLFHLETLPKQALVRMLEVPTPPQAAPVTPQQAAAATRTVSRVLVAIDNILHVPRVIPQHPVMINDGPPPTNIGIGVPGGVGSNTDGVIGSVIGTGTQPTAMVKPAAPNKPIHVSTGIIDGYVLYKPAPPYPVIARTAHVEGVVVLAALISKQGTIENLRILDGPPMLRQAALDTVSTWRYIPYLLNGDPVEVETQVKVIFSLNH
jgi:periplasmic protein TonB